MRLKFSVSVVWILTLLLLSAVGSTAAAQEGEITLSIAVPDNIAEQLNDGLLQQFEAANPGVRVHVIETGGAFFGTFGGVSVIDSYLDSIQERVTEADVLLVNSSDVSPESTQAGYFLDLSPLVAVDGTLNIGDFYTPIWESYQWDGGIWALPVSANISVLLYDPEAFDSAGLDYPQDWWTLYDLESAARALLQYDDNGEPISSIFDLNNNMSAIVVSTLGQSLVNDSVFPAVPDYSNPQLEDIMTIWQGMIQDGVFASGGFSLEAPIILAPSQIAGSNRIAGGKVATLLPGGGAFDVSGYAVSGGTQYPEAAYALATFMSNTPDLASQTIGNIGARRSLAGVTPNSGGGPGRGGPGGGFGGLSEELRTMLEPILETGLSAADIRFANHIVTAVNMMVSDRIDARSALQETEFEVLDRLQTASTRASDIIQVAPPPPEVVLAPGEILLSFGIAGGFGLQATNREWEQAVDDFVAADPEVGDLVLDVENGFGSDLSNLAENYDCFYLSSNAVQGADLSQILSLDPLLSSDPNFDPNNLVGNILEQVQRNNQTWAMPLSLQPEVILYNLDMFNQAGAAEPYPGWTVTDFENALRTIKISPDDPEPLIPQNIGGTYLMVLLAAYGGLPIDYSTDPITLHFDDPAAVEAARQVLDLAREGYIRYEGLGGAFGPRGLVIGFGAADDVALYNQLLNTFLLNSLAEDSNYNLTAFPQGSQIGAVSYDLGTAYISANTQAPEACYRFISTLTQNPTLLGTMPANRSLLNSSALVNSQGQNAADYYNSVDALMSQPNVVLIPTVFSGGIASVGEFLTTDWLNRAFDNYVLDGADLQTELEDAQIKASAFQECISALPPFEPGSGGQQGYFEQINTCAVQADPELDGLFR